MFTSESILKRSLYDKHNECLLKNTGSERDLNDKTTELYLEILLMGKPINLMTLIKQIYIHDTENDSVLQAKLNYSVSTSADTIKRTGIWLRSICYSDQKIECLNNMTYFEKLFATKYDKCCNGYYDLHKAEGYPNCTYIMVLYI